MINITREQIKPKLQTLCESAWDDEEEMLDFLFDEGEYANQ